MSGGLRMLPPRPSVERPLYDYGIGRPSGALCRESEADRIFLTFLHDNQRGVARV